MSGKKLNSEEIETGDKSEKMFNTLRDITHQSTLKPETETNDSSPHFKHCTSKNGIVF